METSAHVEEAVTPQSAGPCRGALATYWLAFLVLIASWDIASRLDDPGTGVASSCDGIKTANLGAVRQSSATSGAGR